MRRGLLGVLGVLLTLVAWHGMAVWPWQLGGLPAPVAVLRSLAGHLVGSELWAATTHTVLMAAGATAIATVIGILVGTVVGMSPVAARYLGSSINSLRFIPPVAFIPVVLLLFGFGASSEILVGVFAAVWPILLNVAASVRGVQDRYRDLVRVERLGTLARMRKIYVPGAVMATLVGVRLAAALALILVVAIEMIAIPAGLGHQIRFLGDALRLDEMYAFIVWTATVGFLINLAVTSSGRVLAPWND